MPNFKDKKIYAAVFTVILLCLFSFIKIKEYFFPFGFANSLRGSADSKVSVEWLIEPTLYRATGFRAGVAWVQEKENGAWKLIDTTGKIIVDGFQAENIGGYYSATYPTVPIQHRITMRK